MIKRWQAITAIFLLGVFSLIPLSEVFHAGEHQTRTVCNSDSDFHFHDEDQACIVCHFFNGVVSTLISRLNFDWLIPADLQVNMLHNPSAISSDGQGQADLRGPPTCG